jgi:putative transposase
MPYEHRNLSEKDKKEIIQRRIRAGFPSHSPPHPMRAAGIYLITAANFEHNPIINTDIRRTKFEQLLFEILEENKINLLAWVILPNHYHILVDIDSLDQVSMSLKKLHGTTSSQ